MKKRVLGIAFCLFFASIAWYLGNIFPVIGGPVFGILLGMSIKQFFNVERYEQGITYSSKKLLQYAIILLGFGLNLFTVLQVGSQSLVIIFSTLTAAFVTAFVVGKTLKLHPTTTTLIGVGTAICGGSAIAATAPVIKAKDEEIAHAISTIFLFNLVAVFVFPYIGNQLQMSDTGFGMWAGTAINDTSSVVAAATVWSNTTGNNTALVFATVVKLTRTLMIIPITFFLAFYTAKSSTNEKTSTFQFAKVFPWFILGFLGAALITTFTPLPTALTTFLVDSGKFFIIMAMTAIGLNTNLKKLLTNGHKPLILGLSTWFAVASVSLLVQAIMKIW